MQGDASRYGHVLVFDNGGSGFFNGQILESTWRIGPNHIKKYVGQEILVIRHVAMTYSRYQLGRQELEDNFGQYYPFHRLALHGFDIFNDYLLRKMSFGHWNLPKGMYTSRMLKFIDWPVCSEYAAQMLQECGLTETGLRLPGWKGLNPDDFDDARLHRPDLWLVVCQGKIL